MKLAPMIGAGFVLGAFAVVGVGMVAVSNDLTAARIAENQRKAMLANLKAIIPAGEMDNDPLKDRIEVSAPTLLGAPVTSVYRVRRNGEPVAVILDPVAPNGYSGSIRLLVSVLRDGTVGGVRVISHRETPGLGDRIEETKSDWILGFTGTSLTSPQEQDWAVRRDGGVFDQFTGATITPRAVVKAVKNTLQFVQSQGTRLFDEPASAVPRS